MYFAHVVKYIPIAKPLAGSEVVLYDIDEEKLRRMAAMAQRLADEAGSGVSVRGTLDLADAVDGADFAIGAIGGAGADASRSVSESYYHQADVRIPAKYGIRQVIGDTGGPAGMMMAFRSVAAYLNIYREMEKRCPSVIVFNHSNPMAVICRAMQKYTGIKTYGICHGVQAGRARAAEILGIPSAELECVWVGTNHYYWFTRLTHRGRDVYPEFRRRLRERGRDGNDRIANDLSEIYGYAITYASDDHIVEFYPFLKGAPGCLGALPEHLAESARRHGYDATAPMPDGPDRSPEARKAFFEFYRKALDAVTLPDRLGDPATGEAVVPLLCDIVTGRRNVHIVNTANEYAVPNLPSHAVLEVEAVSDSCGLRGVRMDEAPPALKGMLEKRIAWQEAVADAAVTGDRRLALQALMLDETAIWPVQAREMLEELLQASRGLLPQFSF